MSEYSDTLAYDAMQRSGLNFRTDTRLDDSPFCPLRVDKLSTSFGCGQSLDAAIG